MHLHQGLTLTLTMFPACTSPLYTSLSVKNDPPRVMGLRVIFFPLISIFYI